MGATSEVKMSGTLTGGVKGLPFAATTVDVAKAGYVEEEYVISGTATRYRLAPGAELGHDGRWDVEAAGTAPYSTRVLVYRPAEPAHFNGTVVVEWNNVSGGYDILTAGLDSQELVDGGFAVAAVTAQRVGVHGLPGGQGLTGWDPKRYGSLSIDSDDYSYDIFTQAARAVPQLLGDLEARKLIAYGASQSAGRLGT